MRESTVLESGLTLDEHRERVARMRAAQGLPPTIQEPTVLQHIADLMRSVDPPPKRKRQRRKVARAS